MSKLCCIKLALSVFVNDFFNACFRIGLRKLNLKAIFFNLFDLFQSFESQSVNNEVLPFSTARKTPMKVPGNLNAIMSGVNITDFRLGFHRKK